MTTRRGKCFPKAQLVKEASGMAWRSWLVVFPASGAVQRHQGALLHVNVGGEMGWSPFIVAGKTVGVIDPRALVVDEVSLRVAYHPRDHLHRVHKAAREWFDLNPNVFRRETPNGATLIDG